MSDTAWKVIIAVGLAVMVWQFLWFWKWKRHWDRVFREYDEEDETKRKGP